MLHVVTDSSCDLPDDLIKRYDIRIVPLVVDIDGELFRERIDITPQEFYKKMSMSKVLPKTSQPTPSAFAETFKELAQSGPVLCLTISSGLSGTYQSACRGKEMSGAEVTVFDSLGGSLGHGLQVLKAAKMAEEGHSPEEILQELETYRREMKILILLNTLENIVRGGRLSKFQGTIGKLLDIRILLHKDSEGKVVLKSKARGKKKFLDMVINEINRLRSNMNGMDIGITHFNNQEDAEYIIRELSRNQQLGEVLIADMGVTMATYAGEGGLIVSF